MVVPTVAAITARRSWRAASSLVSCSCRPRARLLISSPNPLLGGIGSRLRRASSAPGSTTSCRHRRPFDYPQAMEFRVGRITAKCPSCGGTQFKLPADERSGPRMNYLCADCGRPVQYAKLVAQIGREAQRQRHERLSSTGPLNLREPRPAPNSLLVKPVHDEAGDG